MAKDQNEKTDRRVLYTKMFLKESLLELMKEKPVDKITPTELCRKAEINRNTFYTHYYTARDVLEEIEMEFSTQIIDSLSARFSAENIDIPQMLNEICRMIYEKQDFCKILLSENGDAAFLESVITLGKNVIIQGWKKSGVSLRVYHQRQHRTDQKMGGQRHEKYPRRDRAADRTRDLRGHQRNDRFKVRSDQAFPAP